LILQAFHDVRSAGIAQAKETIVETKTPTKGTIMKLIQYQRPGLVWPTLGRLAGLQDELDRLFESPMTGWAPALDVQEDKDNFTIKVELPGLKREDIEVSLQEGALVISGERNAEKIGEGTEVHRQERFYGKFQRALTLPAPVAADKVKAAYRDGVLTVTLPKAEEAKPKQIDVSVN
jgi:HSP20 family protein